MDERVNLLGSVDGFALLKMITKPTQFIHCKTVSFRAGGTQKRSLKEILKAKSLNTTKNRTFRDNFYCRDGCFPVDGEQKAKMFPNYFSSLFLRRDAAVSNAALREFGWTILFGCFCVCLP